MSDKSFQEAWNEIDMNPQADAEEYRKAWDEHMRAQGPEIYEAWKRGEPLQNHWGQPGWQGLKISAEQANEMMKQSEFVTKPFDTAGMDTSIATTKAIELCMMVQNSWLGEGHAPVFLCAKSREVIPESKSE